MRAGLCCVGVAGMLALAACGGAAQPAAQLLAERFAAPEVARAREVAPDLFAAAERARAAAEGSRARGDADAADDETTCARLYLEAALVEVRRVDEERARGLAERATEDADAAAQADEAARLVLEVETTRRAAAQVAEVELARALARAQATEPRRAARLPSGDPEDARIGARALARRARLLLAAARSLGATDAEARPVEVLLAAYEAVPTAHARDADARAIDLLTAADAARRAAETALGEARARLGAPGPEALAALAETAHLAGLEAQASERGVLVYAPAFRGTSSVVEQGAVGALATVLRAHATGPVLVTHEGSSDAAGARLARTRATRLVQALVVAGIPAARLSASGGEPLAPLEGVAPRAVVVLTAYGSAAR